MTTCIAAITADKRIVTASDTRMAFGGALSTSMEGIIKLEEFHREWAALIAGNDIAQAPFIIERANRNLKGKGLKLEVVKEGFRKAVQEQLREDITDEFLAPFHMTLDDFKKKGSRQIEPNVFQAISFGIKNSKVGCRFLCYGFDERKVPHLFEVSGTGKVESRDKPGFWAIGNGAGSAISMLAHLRQNSELTTGETAIYNVLAAKYISESASDVGENTFFFIKKYGYRAFFAKSNWEKDVRTIWKEKGRPSVPQEALEAIRRANIRFDYD